MKIVLLFVSIIGFQLSNAQTFGFRLGPNLVNQRLQEGSLVINPGITVRFHAGVFINSEISKNLCVQIEFGYNGLGHAGSPSYGLKSGKYEYASGGVVFKYYPNKKINFLMGPQLGYLIAGRTAAGQNVADLSPDRADLNAVLGIEFYPSQLIGAGLRYNLGLTNIETISIDRQHNRAIQLSLILRIPGYQLKESGY
jgi:hypothetical protein